MNQVICIEKSWAAKIMAGTKTVEVRKNLSLPLGHPTSVLACSQKNKRSVVNCFQLIVYLNLQGWVGIAIKGLPDVIVAAFHVSDNSRKTVEELRLLHDQTGLDDESLLRYACPVRGAL